MKTLKVAAKLNSPVSLTYDLMLDTLLISQKAKQLGLSDDNFNPEEAIEIREEVGYISDFPLCSKAFLKGKESTHKYYKRFDEESETFNCKKKIETGKGKFKNYSNTINITHTKEVYFYCVGNKELIEKLLQGITAIGKKISQGFGLVGEWSIEETEERNWLDVNNILRPIPIDFFSKNNNKNIKYVSYKFPYWYNGNKKKCYV